MANPSLVAGLGAATIASGVGIAVGTSSKTPWFMSMFDSSEVTYKYQQFPCAGKLFKKVDWKDSANGGNTEELKKIHLKSSGVSGCISVRWEKNYHKDNDWRGNWNVLWGMADSTHGTIFISTLISGHKKTVDGLFYILEKNGADSWKVIGKKAVERQDISSLEDNLVVQPGNTLDKPRGGWCFLSNLNTDTDCSKNRAQLIWNYKPGKLERVNNQELPADNWSTKITDYWISSTGQFGVDFKDIYKDVKGYFAPE